MLETVDGRNGVSGGVTLPSRKRKRRWKKKPKREQGSREARKREGEKAKRKCKLQDV